MEKWLRANHLKRCHLMTEKKASEDFTFCNCQDLKTNIHKIDSILFYLHQNVHILFSPKEMAEKIGYSKRHFQRIFKQYTDMNYGQYNISMRIQIASQQLVETELPISSIADSLGLSHKHLCYLFQQKWGMSPREYRKKYGDGNSVLKK